MQFTSCGRRGDRENERTKVLLVVSLSLVEEAWSTNSVSHYCNIHPRHESDGLLNKLMQMNQQQRLEHNRIVKEATDLIEYEISLLERPNNTRPNSFVRFKLLHALSLFERVLQLNPANWSAMWQVGKIHQRLGDSTTAFSWFERAYQVNPSQPSIAREASLSAMDIGNHNAAIVFGHRATQIEPASADLHANLALAFLYANRITEAQASIERSLAIDPTDTISQAIEADIKHFATTGRIPPATTSAFEDYVRTQRKVGQ